jgi:hypothetical protein
MILADRADPPLDRNNALVMGYSQLTCYQPIFGYRLESMISGPIQAGPALANLADNVLNVKNPACYLFPRENSCRAGDHFRTDQLEAARQFLRYESFPFQISSLQQIADIINLYSIILAGLLLLSLIVLAMGGLVGKKKTVCRRMLSNRTGGSPASGSRTRLHAFTHGTFGLVRLCRLGHTLIMTYRNPRHPIAVHEWGTALDCRAAKSALTETLGG